MTSGGTKWEADQMLNAYILDYLKKKNFTATASAFEKEANVPTEPVLINAPEGFVLEWWSVFWDIFSARTKKPASENAKSYVEKQKDRGSYSLRRPQLPVSGIPSGSLRIASGLPQQLSPIPHSVGSIPIPAYTNTQPANMVPSFGSQGQVVSGPSNLPSPPAQSQGFRDGTQGSFSQQQSSVISTQQAAVNSVVNGQNQHGNTAAVTQQQQPVSSGGNQYTMVQSRNRTIATSIGYPNINQVQNNGQSQTGNDRVDYINARSTIASRTQTAVISGSNQIASSNNTIAAQPLPSQQSAQGVSPSSRSVSSSPNGTTQADAFNPDRRRNVSYAMLPNTHSYRREQQFAYSKPGDSAASKEGIPDLDSIKSERRTSFPNVGTVQTNQPPTGINSGVVSQPKEQNDLNANGSVPNNNPYTSNTPTMNNPIPNPNIPSPNPSGTNGSGDSSQSSETNDMSAHYLADKNRKRARPPSSSKAPMGVVTNSAQNEAFYNQQQQQSRSGSKLNLRRGRPAFPASQTGYAMTQSPQGNSQTQSTPPSHPSPSTQPSPSPEVQESPSPTKRAYSSGYLAVNSTTTSQYSTAPTGQVSTQNNPYATGPYGSNHSSTTNLYNTSNYSYPMQGMSYNGQNDTSGSSSTNYLQNSYNSMYSTSGKSMPNSSNNSSSYTGSVNYKVVNSATASSGMVGQKKQYVSKQSMNHVHHDQATEDLISDKDGGSYPPIGIDNNMFSSDQFYRNIPDTEMYFEHGIEADGSIENLLL
jgi:hypothetical protein